MIQCLAIDDEPLALQQLASYISRVPFLHLVGQCRDTREARQLMEREPIDALFVDINMPDENGLELIRSLKSSPLVVFTTAYAEYALEGYKVNAVDYLLKPFGFDDFQRTAMKLRRQYGLEALQEEGRRREESCEMRELFVKVEHRIVRVSVADIRYIEGMSEYVKIHLVEGKPVIALLSMKRLEERLPANFMRIHRSYIVNLDKVHEVNKNRVILDEHVYLPIGDQHREKFAAYVKNNFLEK